MYIDTSIRHKLASQTVEPRIFIAEADNSLGAQRLQLPRAHCSVLNRIWERHSLVPQARIEKSTAAAEVQVLFLQIFVD